jgi:hypothetical protein
MAQSIPKSFSELYPGRFLKADMLRGEVRLLTIRGVVVDELQNEDGQTERRGVLQFNETPRELTLNKINGLCLRAMFGANPQDWVGHGVYLSPERDRLGREEVDCIRVFGSPDIDTETVDVVIKYPRKRAFTRKLYKESKK